MTPCQSSSRKPSLFNTGSSIVPRSLYRCTRPSAGRHHDVTDADIASLHGSVYWTAHENALDPLEF